MINTVRKVLLLIAFGVIGAAGFYIFQNLNTSIDMGNIKIKVMEKGVDVEIENFRVAHEVKGVKEWELKADLAQIDNQQELTQLQKVEMVIHKEDRQQYIISADAGTYISKSKDVNLVGNVKLVGSANILKDRLSKTTKKSNTKPMKTNEK